MEPAITKRLHISGLTPSISQQDLLQRLSTFGSVKSLDGLGNIDAVGRPKKFAYATLEATPTKLSRCLNTLSGSTWKGAKLRIGEAKPDFRERVKAENEKFAAEAKLSRKKRRLKYAPYTATHAKDMTPISLETAEAKSSWMVTPSGRIHRPLRMRPLRPLPPPVSTGVSRVVKDPKGKGKQVKGGGPFKERKRIKKADARARRRKIDMTKYGSEYLRGRLLDVDILVDPHPNGLPEEMSIQLSQESDGDESDEERTGVDDSDEQSLKERSAPTAPAVSASLKDLFAPTEDKGGFSLLGHLDLDDDLELDGDVPFPTTQQDNNNLATESQDVQENIISVPATSTTVATSDSQRARQISQITLDPTQPLFFPLSLLATHPAAADSSIFTNPNLNLKNRPKDMYDTLREQGWDWPSSGFYRTQTEDEIRQRWEEQKGELTQSWKKRWREAVKLGRRRGKVGAGEEV